MNYYHGSIVPDIDILKPHANPDSNLSKSCIYFTSLKELSVFYIWNKPYKWLTYGFKDKKVIYTESFENSLKYFYKGISGCLYTVDDDLTIEPGVGIYSAAISEKPVKVKKIEYVNDVFEKINSDHEDGKIIIRWYSELTQKEHMENENMILNAIANKNLINKPNIYTEFIKEKFPELWDKAVKKSKEI